MPSVPRRRAGWPWVFSTSSLALLWVVFLVANLRASLANGRPVGLGAMLLELIVATLYVLRRQSHEVSSSVLAWFAAGIGAFGLLAARPHYRPIGDLEPLYLSLQLLGAAIAATSLVVLGRSFGVVAANRGIQTAGPYRIVRHPAYAGYVIAMSGYFLENPSLRNAVIIVTVAAVQLVRIQKEEAYLRADPKYAAYRLRVRYRLLPYVY